MSGFVKKKKNAVILLVCILLHTAVLYGICDFSKNIETYGDELLYYSIARSLFLGQGITVHGVPFQFQNLAYSFYLIPFFFISNSILRMQVITLANAFLMSLSLIPVWFLCKELKLKEPYKWFVIILVMASPDMFTVGTLMSENLYWVLSLTALYFCVKAILSCKKSDSCIAAVCCYFAYFCKEVGICIALAYIGFGILNPLIDGLTGSNDMQENAGSVLTRINYSYRKFFENKIWMNLFLFIIVYGFCYLFFKNVLFREVNSFYTSVMDFSFMSDGYRIFYMVYGFLYYILASILAFMVYPMLYPIAHYRNIGQAARKAFLYGLVLFVGTIVVIILTITVREDLGKIVPRIHLRYMAPMIGLFLPVFFKSLSDIEEDHAYIRKSRKTIVIICIWFWVMSTFFYKGVLGGCVTENASLAFSQFLSNHIGNLDINGNHTVVFYPTAIVTSIGLGFLLLVWNGFEHFKKKYFPFVVFFSFLLLSVTDFSTGIQNLYKYYQADKQQISEMGLINSYFKNHGLEDKHIMFVCEGWGIKNAKIYDTYFDSINSFEISYKALINTIYERAGERIPISDIDFHEEVWGTPYQIDEIDYFISSNDMLNLDSVMDGLEMVPEISGENFVVYKNLDTSQISLRKDQFVEINFDAENYNAPLFVQSGISQCEGAYTWTDGNKMQVRTFANTEKSLKVHFYLTGIFQGQQRVIVQQGENVIFEEAICGVNEFEFELSPINGDCSFQVYFPDAVSPYELGMSADERKLAISLEKITFEKIE